MTVDADPARSPLFGLTITIRGKACVLALSGALDHDSVIAFESQFDQLVAGDVTCVELDIDGLRSLDAAGVRSLNRLGQLLSDRGTELVVGGMAGPGV